MRDFLKDTIEDLRERRLWPVAVLLVLAILGLPVLMKSHGSEVASQPAAPTTPPPQLKPLAALAKLDKLPKVSLRSLSSRDPFGGRPVPKLTSLADAANAVGAKGTGGEPAGPVGGGSTGAGSAPASPSVGSPSAPTYGYKAPAVPRKVVYSFQVDVAFGDPQDLRERRGLKRFAMLPNSSAPLLVFLGVDSTETKAVFLVDASLSQFGEGHCRDSGCSFVELGPGNEHSFADPQGRTYLLRVDQFRKVRVRRRAHASASRRPRAKASAAEGGFTRGDAPRGRRFLSPLFGDQIEKTVQR